MTGRWMLRGAALPLVPLLLAVAPVHAVAADPGYAAAYDRAVAVALLLGHEASGPALAKTLTAAFPKAHRTQVPARSTSPAPGDNPDFQYAPAQPLVAPGPSQLPFPATGSTTNHWPAGATAGWVCPVQGDVKHSDDWGGPRIGGRKHEGNDLFAPAGSPIVAIGDGVVRDVQHEDTYVPGSGKGNLGGKWVSYFTTNGDRWYHAHLQDVEPNLRPGTVIRAGQKLGTVGTSGDAHGTPPHDHVEYRPGGGEKTNPYPLLKKLCGKG